MLVFILELDGCWWHSRLIIEVDVVDVRWITIDRDVVWLMIKVYGFVNADWWLMTDDWWLMIDDWRSMIDGWWLMV